MKVFLIVFIIVLLIFVFIMLVLHNTHDSVDRHKPLLEFMLQSTFGNNIKYQYVYGHLGDDTDVVNYIFEDDNDWLTVVQFVKAEPDMKYYRCYRMRGDYMDEIFIDIDSRLLQIRTGVISMPKEEQKTTDWVIHPTSKFLGTKMNFCLCQ